MSYNKSSTFKYLLGRLTDASYRSKRCTCPESRLSSVPECIFGVYLVGKVSRRHLRICLEMDIKECIIRIVLLLEGILIFVTIQASISHGENSYNSHKISGISHIPWNMLLDPNYTSHKLTPSLNRTSFSPSHYDEYSPSKSFSHQQSSFSFIKDSASPGVYYVPPPTTQNPSKNHVIKYSPPFVDQDHKLSGSFSPTISRRPTEKVMFPAASSFHVSRPEATKHYASTSQQKNKKMPNVLKENDSKKHKRKPDNYFDIEDDDDNEYLDSYYQDYDYAENDRVSYKPSKQSSHYNKHKETGDPLGLLPSASDPNGFFAKAKDLLRGGSYSKPSYSSSGSSYYTNYPPDKQHMDYESHGGHSYYDQEAPAYPSKESHYEQPGYDFNAPYSDGHYGGVIPYPDKRKVSKYGPLAFALGLLPLGLLLASLVPTVVTIPVTTAVATGRRRKRSVRFVNPVLETISEYGVTALEDPTCLNRIFCQVVRDGKQERSSIVQKLYFKIATLLDEKFAASVGLKPLILAVRKDECHQFQCSTKSNSTRSNND